MNRVAKESPNRWDRMMHGAMGQANIGPDPKAAPEEPAKRVVPNPVGVGLVLTGAAAMLIAVFLPQADSPIVGIESNTLIQSGDGWGLVSGAVILAAAVYVAYSRQKKTWTPIVVGVLALALAFYESKHLGLYRLGPDGNPDPAQPLNASPGIGIYLAGIGGFFALAGGYRLRRSPEIAAPEVRETKQCPDCAERVLADANVCKHCGHRFLPSWKVTSE